MKRVVANALNFCAALSELQTSEENEDYAALIAEYSDLIDVTLAETAKNENANTDVVSGAALFVTKANTVSFAFGNVGSGNTLYASYETAEGTKTVKLVQRGAWYVLEGMSVADMTGDITLTAGGETVLVYNLAALVEASDNAVIEAFYGFAKAAAAYQN